MNYESSRPKKYDLVKPKVMNWFNQRNIDYLKQRNELVQSRIVLCHINCIFIDHQKKVIYDFEIEYFHHLLFCRLCFPQLLVPRLRAEFNSIGIRGGVSGEM